MSFLLVILITFVIWWNGALETTLFATLSLQVWDATPEPVFSIKAVAMDSKDNPDGYEAVVYHTTTTLMANTEVIVSQVGEEANWKMCTNVSMDTIHGDGKVTPKWVCRNTLINTGVNV